MTDHLIFIYKGNEGNFRTEVKEKCSFVLTKGEKKGQLCGNKITFSTFFNTFIPCCILHLNHYEAKFGQFTQTFERSAKLKKPRFYEELDEDVDIKQFFVKKEKDMCFDTIPKAIERSIECIICFENNNSILLPCGHTVCFACIQSLSKKSCPMCRSKFTKPQLRRL